MNHNARFHGIRVASTVWATTTSSPPSEIASPAAKLVGRIKRCQELSNDKPVHFVQNRAILYVISLAGRCLKLSVELLLDANPHHRHHGTWFTARAATTRALLVLAAVRSGLRPCLKVLIGQVIGAGGRTLRCSGGQKHIAEVMCA
ncbi:uncharacterized protein LY79DRAFT_583845 [Colletotrichum navitas]|uniref:Uncharacterized protein n=1 Tax=Colletotrichum navitas TaxID=681940 RepID=A0AAD8PP52_9PEZI|nr:uncharacterized protein LY79DRAFT_583845 [Colletotrichum navitas]KAK1573113.1 hypothetical protein LY79DRAFT_583845 [Colletotrichum navitas]